MAPAFVTFLVRRVRAHARLEALAAVGALAAAALMAAVIVYADAVRDLGLTYALGRYPADALDVTVYSSSQRLAPTDNAVREEETRRHLRSALGGLASEYLRYGRTATFFLTPPGAPVPPDEDRPRAHFQFFDGLEARVRVLAGRPPRPASPPAQGAPAVEAWVSSQAAQQLGIAVGDRFDLHPFWALDVEPIHVEVVGIFEPLDPADRAWRSREERLAVTSTRWPTYPFFVPEATVTGALVAYLPSIDAAFETIAVVDTEAIDSRNAPGLAHRLRALAANLPRAVPRTQVDTELPAAIELYRTKLFFTRLPLFALVVQIVGIVLLYLVLVSSLLADRRADEWALLRSRGASSRHVLLLAGAEAALIAVPAALRRRPPSARRCSAIRRRSGPSPGAAPSRSRFRPRPGEWPSSARPWPRLPSPSRRRGPGGEASRSSARLPPGLRSSPRSSGTTSTLAYWPSRPPLPTSSAPKGPSPGSGSSAALPATRCSWRRRPSSCSPSASLPCASSRWRSAARRSLRALPEVSPFPSRSGR